MYNGLLTTMKELYEKIVTVENGVMDEELIEILEHLDIFVADSDIKENKKSKELHREVLTFITPAITLYEYNITGQKFKTLWDRCCENNMELLAHTILVLGGDYYRPSYIDDNLNETDPISFIEIDAINSSIHPNHDQWKEYCMNHADNFHSRMDNMKRSKR